jgi:hypothetical protein
VYGACLGLGFMGSMCFLAFPDQGIFDISVPHITAVTYLFQTLVLVKYVVHSHLKQWELNSSDANVMQEKDHFVQFMSHEVNQDIDICTLYCSSHILLPDLRPVCL